MRMKAIIASILVFILIVMSCSTEEVTPEFKGMNDPDLLPYIEDTLYAELVSSLDNEEYFVENVSAIYISEEYLEELEFNSQSNIYFGYTLAELEAQFLGDRYVFTLGADNETTFEPWEAYDDTYDRVIKNVTIGTGVILVCVTISIVTANPASAIGAGKAIKLIYAISTTAAKQSAIKAIRYAGFGGITTAIIEGYLTKDFKSAMKAGAVTASEGYKWGAITGVVKSVADGLIHIGDTTYFKASSKQAIKYSEGVQFTETNGIKYPRFEKWAKAIAKFDQPTVETALNHTGLSGNYYWDSKLANQMCGYKSTPSGYVWHHVEDMKTLILIPRDLHSIAVGGMPHTGGASLIKAYLGLL